jgi:recombinase-like zinc beta ribbon protein
MEESDLARLDKADYTVLDARAFIRSPNRPSAYTPSLFTCVDGQNYWVKHAGMLRCGECGEAMVPRSNDRGWVREIYYCNGYKFGCKMGSMKREAIDRAVFDYFAQVGLDLEATRKTMVSAHDRKLNEIRTLSTEAEREAQLAADRLARVRRAFQDGKLEPEDWTEQREQLQAERDAAEAEAKRLRASESEVERDAGLMDAEQEMISYMAEIRQTIVGEIRDAEDAEAVRAALSRLFERFIIHRSTPERVHLELVGEVWIEPVVREQAVEGYTSSMTPILRREPLQQAENNQHVALP